MTITRVPNSYSQGTSTSSPINVTLNQTPTIGNVLIAAISLYNNSGSVPTVSAISQQGGNVSWTQIEGISSIGWNTDLEIWAGVVNSGTITTVNIALSGPPNNVCIADVCEYSGLSTTSFKDVSTNSIGVGNPSATGTVTTSQANELWVGCVSFINPVTQSPLSDGFTMLDGLPNGSSSLAYLEKIVNSVGTANSGSTGNGYSGWLGCIAAFKGQTGSTITVPYNGLYSGNGSKQTTVSYNGANVIMQVQANVPSQDFSDSAVIENLIIDGQNYSETTGILLQNVYNCCIRNVTIQNCDVGIEVDITGSNWSQSNRFEHIRMRNVKTGIRFSGTSTNKDFSFPVIDDVGIDLQDSSSVGIQIGNPYATIYNAFIKANVWLGSTNGTGMIVNGDLKLSLVNLEVEENFGSNGTGLIVNSGAHVTDNQNFLLTTGSISNTVINNGTTDGTLTVKSF